MVKGTGVAANVTRILLLALGLVVAACGAATTTTTDQESPGDPATTTTTSGDSPTSTSTSGSDIPFHLQGIVDRWETDFSKTTINLDELLVGIPASDPRDLIRPIDAPVFEATSETDWIGDNEPGVMLDIEGDVRFYPLAVLTRHEIVNDEVGGLAVAVTYCPLCNTAVVFDRRFGGETLRLGVSGLLRNSDLVMWDNKTQTLWQQITGEGIVGENAGGQLTILAAGIVRWADFEAQHPNGLALAANQGFGDIYGVNPYELYSSRDRPYGFFQGDIDERYPALERVVGVSVGESDKAFPFSLLQEIGAVNDQVGGTPVVVFWGSPDTADALDSSEIAASRGIGTGVAYSPVVDGEALTFSVSGDGFEDEQTGSSWTILGLAVSGELAGTQLELIPHRNEFWFAWQAFFPDAEVWEP